MKPTVKKIAQDLGLSPATVSKALSGRHEISDETKERVRLYAHELGYLKSPGQRKRFGVLAVNPDDMEDSQTSLMFSLLMGFQKYADRLDLDVVVFHINGDTPETLDQFAYKNKFDGLFVTGIKNTDPYYLQLETTTTPIVTLDIHAKNPLVGNVGTNSISGGALAIRHLTQLGHRRIGFVNGHKEAYISQERLAGYLAALYNHAIPFDPGLCFDGNYSMESGTKAAEYFAKTDTTAIYFASDLMALGAIRRFKTLGYELPRDMSIVGFDNQLLCQGCTPTLTTIAQNPAALGETACALLRGLSQKTPICRAQLEPWLIERESTAPPFQ
ncbi:MAG: LacI family transcriptional regulator [Defluviitaleaceae bacterium]|nr:LacI family transcriptional regulator [Defluviitaleaceae bacterium]MCL2238883.1 LacI family transcriptional regulator [Defluviitaleaceae bacterium]